MSQYFRFSSRYVESCMECLYDFDRTSEFYGKYKYKSLNLSFFVNQTSDFYVFQIEKSPTLGSIETSDYEKKQFALQSLEFNLRNKIFCELFPDTVTGMKVSIHYFYAV